MFFFHSAFLFVLLSSHNRLSRGASTSTHFSISHKCTHTNAFLPSRGRTKSTLLSHHYISSINQRGFFHYSDLSIPGCSTAEEFYLSH